MGKWLFPIFMVAALSVTGQQAMQITELSSVVQETSGLLFFDGRFYTFNDSGGDAALYEIDTVSGDVKNTITVGNAQNQDWEAITSDRAFVYIGDIGNNHGNRKDLVIYKCPIEGLGKGKLQAEAIHFSYKDQDDFDHEAHAHEYDAEGLFVRDGKLFLISKNWTKNESKIYEVPVVAGDYTLEHVAKVDVYGKVTDAFFDEQGQSLFLIGYGDFPFITCMKNFNGNNAEEEITLPINSPNGIQTEGIIALDGKVFYTSEKVQMFEAELARFFASDFDHLVEVKVKGNSIKLKTSISMDVVKLESKKGKSLYKVTDLGKKCARIPLKDIDPTKVVYLKVKLIGGAQFKMRINPAS